MEQRNDLERPLFETETKHGKIENPVLEHNAVFFLVTALIYSVCFAVAFYNNYVGITFPLITIATVVVCGLFLKKSGISWKKQNLYYIVPVILLGISTMLTANGFTVFFNTVGILLLLTAFMMQQVYPDKKWNLGQYICNMLFLYISMIPEVAAPFVNLGKYIRRKRVKEEKKYQYKIYYPGNFNRTSDASVCHGALKQRRCDFFKVYRRRSPVPV